MSHASRTSAKTSDLSMTISPAEAQTITDPRIATHLIGPSGDPLGPGGDPLAATALANTLPSPKLHPRENRVNLDSQRRRCGHRGRKEVVLVHRCSTVTFPRPPKSKATDQKPLGRGAYGTVGWRRRKTPASRLPSSFTPTLAGLIWCCSVEKVESLAFLYTERDVVQLLAVGWDHEPPYYVMEYLPHGSLEERLRNGPLPLTDAVTITKVVARALQKSARSRHFALRFEARQRAVRRQWQTAAV